MKRWKDKQNAVFQFQAFNYRQEGNIYRECHRITVFRLSETESPKRSLFPSDTAFLKGLYVDTFKAGKRWTGMIRSRAQEYGELSVMYEGRFSEQMENRVNLPSATEILFCKGKSDPVKLFL